jgi:cell division septation protein DedD
MAKDDRDRIKEILEGHQKKVSFKTIIITAILVVIAGLVVGYFIMNMKEKSPKTIAYNMKKLEKINMNKKKPNSKKGVSTIDNKTLAQNEIDATKEGGAQETISKHIEAQNGSEIDDSEVEKNLNSQIPKTYEVKSEIQEENDKKSKNSQMGPKIVNPYKKTQKHKEDTQNQFKEAKKSDKEPKAEIKKIQNKAKSVNKELEKKAENEIEIAKKALEKKEKKLSAVKKNIKTDKKQAQSKIKKDETIYQYVIQISSHKNKKQAVDMAAKLKKAGYNAYIKSVVINSQLYNRVLVGPYKGYFKAKTEASSIKTKLKLNYTPMIKKYD